MSIGTPEKANQIHNFFNSKKQSLNATKDKDVFLETDKNQDETNSYSTIKVDIYPSKKNPSTFKNKPYSEVKQIQPTVIYNHSSPRMDDITLNSIRGSHIKDMEEGHDTESIEEEKKMD